MDIDNSLFLIDKKAGRTSHDEVDIVRSALWKAGLKAKVGHSGTLDPKVTGLLVVGIGKGTRMLEYMLDAPKQYTGEILFHESVTREQLEKAIEHFVGNIEQLPPRRSSVKRELRTRAIYSIEILEFSTRKATLQCRVEKGTYIRKLFHDIGEYMNTKSHMGDLHRTHVGPYVIDEKTLSAEEFKIMVMAAHSHIPFLSSIYRKKLSQHVLSMTSALPDVPQLTLWPEIERHLTSGEPLFVPGVQRVDSFKKNDLVQIISDQQKLIALGYAEMDSDEIQFNEKGLAIKMHKVFL